MGQSLTESDRLFIYLLVHSLIHIANQYSLKSHDETAPVQDTENKCTTRQTGSKEAAGHQSRKKPVTERSPFSSLVLGKKPTLNCIITKGFVWTETREQHSTGFPCYGILYSILKQKHSVSWGKRGKTAYLPTSEGQAHYLQPRSLHFWFLNPALARTSHPLPLSSIPNAWNAQDSMLTTTTTIYQKQCGLVKKCAGSAMRWPECK